MNHENDKFAIYAGNASTPIWHSLYRCFDAPGSVLMRMCSRWGVGKIRGNLALRKRERERNVLFNDALNTFYLRLYGVIWVKDHSDSEKGNPLPPHRLLLSINKQQGFFYMHHPTDRITHTTAFVTPVVEHWLEREIAQWVHPMKDRSDDPSHHERTLYLGFA